MSRQPAKCVHVSPQCVWALTDYRGLRFIGLVRVIDMSRDLYSYPTQSGLLSTLVVFVCDARGKTNIFIVLLGSSVYVISLSGSWNRI